MTTSPANRSLSPVLLRKVKSMLLAQFSSIFTSTNVFWLAITLMVVVPSLAYYWQQVKKNELDAGLKQSMIDRGMSADEIERILHSGSKNA